ncbi:AEC family transporter [Nibricoccus sp. IMCC34717]|uniref:AEC family transporter n=1 Tax=Nibricoccus sp. IMCC34717 TaxID=3034021 RepID=UPI00384D7F8B
MPSYWQLLLLLVPVFALMAIGVVTRKVGWLSHEADSSLLKLVFNCLYPCLIFENVVNNTALQDPRNLAFAPTLGFACMASCMLIAYAIASLVGMKKGQGRRAFGYSVGVNNFGYIPIPLMTALFGKDSLGTLLVHNVGCEAAIWTIGIFLLSGTSFREGWRRMINAPVIALIVALVGNQCGLGPLIPKTVWDIIHACAVCAVPLGLILSGAVLAEFLVAPRTLVDPVVTPLALGLRLGLLPLVFFLATLLPITREMKQVLIVQAAMPCGAMTVAFIKHHGGHTLTGVRALLGTTALGIFTIPLWLKVGLAWLN